MSYTAASLSPVAKVLPLVALDVFIKAARYGADAGMEHNECIRQGWAATRAAGWEPPITGKKWVLVNKDNPDSSDVHVQVPMGGRKKKTADEEFETACAKVIKVDASLGLVFGWAIVCKENGQEYFDVQGDHIPEDGMLEAAADFMENSRVHKDMHQGDEVGPVVFCWPMTADIAKAMEIQTATTGLMIAIKPPAAILAKYQSGEYTGFSIGGRRRVDVEVD